jgi:hypothetical protein
MATPLNTNGFSLISNVDGSGIASQLGRQLATEVAMSGYGELGKQDVGWAVTRAVDITRTVQSFAAIPMVDEAKHSSFAFFREAMAQSAQTQTSDLMQKISAGNMERAELNKIISGQSYTGFYADAVSGQQAVAPLLANTPNSPEALLDFSNVNFNDNQSVTEYLNRIREYSSTINLRNNIDLNAAAMQSEEYELLILMHTENKEAYGQYIQQFETQIQQNFQKELTSLQNNVKSMGYTGDVKDLKALEIFKNTQSGANASQVQQLIDATNGKINQVDRYILARIHNGDIDMQKILTTGEFNGVKLDEKSLSAFKALNIYANSDQITTNFHNETLAKIGFKSSMQNVDLNNLKHVTARVKEFEDALTKAGYGAINGKALSKLSIKEMREIDLSKISDPNALNAMKQYISLRDHKETLSQAKNMMANFRMRMVNLARKALGDSDLSQGIGQIQSGYHNAKIALKVWNRYGAPVAKKIFKFFNKTTLKLIKHMPAPIRNAYFKNLKFIRTIAGKARELWGRVASAPRKAAQKIASKATQALTKKSTSVAARQVAKHATRVARSTERKLILKAGQKVGEAIRHVAHLATSGAIGTTGAGAAAVTTTTAATATTVAAGATTVAAGATTTAAGVTTVGATAGTGGMAAIPLAAAFVVILWVVLIGMIIYLCGGIIQTIACTPLALEDTLLGKIINFFANFKWPWEDKYPTEEEKQNVLHYTLTQLLVEQDNWHKLENQPRFYGGTRPYDINGKVTTSDGQGVTFGGAQTLADTNHLKENSRLVYRFVGTDGYGHTYPINEYSTTKLAISMAHAFTYPIETQDHLANFSLYATGLWRYLNQVEIRCTLKFCTSSNMHKNPNGTIQDGCGSFTYRCDTYHASQDSNPMRLSGLYDEIDRGLVKILTRDELKNGISITTSTPSYFYVTNGPIAKERIPGVDYSCLYSIYNPNGPTSKGVNYGRKDTYDRNTSSRYSESGRIPITYFEDINPSDVYNWDKLATDEIPNSPYMKDNAGNSFRYGLMPNICNICLTNKHIEYGSEQGIRDHTSICNSTVIARGGCNNISRKLTSHTKTKMHCPTTILKLTNSHGKSEELKIVTTHDSDWISYADYAAYESQIEEEMDALLISVGHNPHNGSHVNLRDENYVLESAPNSDRKVTDEEKTKFNQLQHIMLHHDLIFKYVCQGHGGITYCEGSTPSTLTLVVQYSSYTDGDGKKCVSPKTQDISWYSTKKCCDNCIAVSGVPYSKWQELSTGGVVRYKDISTYWTTYYVCKGGISTHGEFTDAATKNICQNYETLVAEICDGNGYDKIKSNWQTICLGHVQCVNSSSCTLYTNNNNEHVHACPGHTLYYCGGQEEYIFTQQIMDSDSEAIFSNDWSYTTTGKFLWIEKTYTYSPMGYNNTIKLARDDWAGWTENNRELMMGVLTDDWYSVYGYGISSFVGAEISPSERNKYKEHFNISSQTTSEQLMKNLEFAFDSIGKIAYYPNDKASYPAYDSRNKFYTQAPDFQVDSGDNKGYVLNAHGLDYKYYADWVYLSTHEGKHAPNNLLTENYYMCGTRVTQQTLAGTPIVTHGSATKTGILIGVKGNVVTYIGLSDAGWATIIDSTETWYTASDLQL